MSLSFKDNSAAMTIGPQMEGLYGQARGLAPNSPRVAFLDALNTMHKPTFFGGGTDKAMPKFVQAIALFDSSATSGGMAPNWGRDDANLWAGRAAAKLGDNTRARRYYDAALTANPDNAWVRNSLIPALTAAPAPSAKGKTGK